MLIWSSAEILAVGGRWVVSLRAGGVEGGGTRENENFIFSPTLSIAECGKIMRAPVLPYVLVQPYFLPPFSSMKNLSRCRRLFSSFG
jgi:hypothetical protein